MLVTGGNYSLVWHRHDLFPSRPPNLGTHGLGIRTISVRTISPDNIHGRNPMTILYPMTISPEQYPQTGLGLALGFGGMLSRRYCPRTHSVCHENIRINENRIPKYLYCFKSNFKMQKHCLIKCNNEQIFLFNLQQKSHNRS